MITFKCKMCGGDLSFEQGASVAECPYCGTNQTLPKLDDGKRANLYDRANHFRRQNEYDKAMAIYEQILAEDRTDAEAYWSLVLCRYGIEYVEDPATHKRVPTVNRVQYASILADEDYKSALANADAAQRGVYEAEANAIAEMQKGILDISKQEEPFDVFICYKETDANGRRTPDSVLATEMYHELTKEGFKVFFSRITLEDKIGSAYEPYIFAALNSARVMVALGTKPEYFNAVWVKNEWSRYLALIRAGADKTLVPAYRDMDPYDLPEEFAHLQAQDMGKLGFMQDLIRGIKKILKKDEPRPQTAVAQPTAAPAGNVAPLLERSFMFLEDGDWSSADEYAEKVLDLDPKNGRAYLGKLMAELKVRREGDLKNQPQPFDGNGNYQKTVRFGDEALKLQLKADIEFIRNRNEHARQKGIFDKASNVLQKATTVDHCLEAIKQLQTIPDFDGVKVRIEDCNAKIEGINASNYQKAVELQVAGSWQQAIRGFKALKGYRDSREKIMECEEGIRADAFQSATTLKDNRKWSEAIAAFEKLGDYRDSREKIMECEEGIRADAFQSATTLKDNRKWSEAIAAFEKLGDYRDSRKQAELCRDAQEAERRAEEARREQERRQAEAKAKAEAAKRRTRTIVAVLLVVVIAAGAFAYVKIIKPNGIYNSALKALDAGNYEEAGQLLLSIKGFKDADGILASDERLKYVIGNTISFGCYEQDDNTANGSETIEWIVLANDGHTATLISKYGLDAKPYNTENEGVTWESCTLRKWLNGDFLNAAFNAEEQTRLETVTVTADKNPPYNTNPGNDTQDKVFLLSIAEADRYFGSDDARICKPTKTAVSDGAYTGNSGACWWWLRSPGGNTISAASVRDVGFVDNYGYRVYSERAAVRPVVVLRLS